MKHTTLSTQNIYTTTIQWEKSTTDLDFFPVVLFNNGMINETLYKQLKQTFPNFNDFKISNCGQKYRKNIELRTRGNKNHIHNVKVVRSKYPAYYKLFQYITSDDFKQALLKQFTRETMKHYGFKGDLKHCEAVMQICESTGGYENPFHVDSRKRIVHGLLYFGKENIQSGGELCIAKHKHLNGFETYPQYPQLDDLEQIKAFPPNDNFGLFVLSVPNSYHKGNITVGTRQFIYISLDYTGGDRVAWKCGWTHKTKPFDIGLKQQKNNRETYNSIQKTISDIS